MLIPITPMLLRTILALLLFSVTYQTNGEEDEIQLRLRRNFGYSSGTGSIQGNFTLTASGPEDLAHVIFYIDDQPLGESSEPPFQVRFITDDFPLGLHTLTAIGTASGGSELRSNEIRAQFVSPEEGWQAAGRIMIPILAIIGVAVLLSMVIPFIFTRGKKEILPLGAPRNYGFRGGAICPRCKRPFVLHIYGLNLIGRKYDRCPYCGKWSLVRRANRNELTAAETAELAFSQGDSPESEISSQEDLKREIEESRYQDL